MKKSMLLFACLSVSLVTLADGRFSPFGISISTSSAAGQDSQFPGRQDYVYGWRFAVFSAAHKRMVGLATAVFANDDNSVYGGDVGGLQVASIFNTASNAELGLWQLAGFHNKVGSGCNGLHLCVFYNLAYGYFNGLQLALRNEAKSDYAGAQVGLFNEGNTVMGTQIGLINTARSLKGMQIGLMNFVEESVMTAFPVIRIGW